MKVSWLIQAQDKLQDSLGLQTQAQSFLSLMNSLSQQLEATFPEAEQIVVIDRLNGYSESPSKHILRIEVFQQGSTLARVVKLGPTDRLEKEWAGWQCCLRPANERGVAFMSLEEGAPAGASGQFASLIYQDAQQTLRAAQVTSLEEALLACCRWGVPSVGSLIAVLDQLVAELADRVYRRSGSQSPDANVVQYFQARLQDGLNQWNRAGGLAWESRRAAQRFLEGIVSSQYDPVHCLQVLLTSNHPEDLPAMQRGCAHGDLNGRNIIVGVFQGEARWPAVFDYEDMGAENFLGWDFVKLETELKIRAYEKLFPTDEQSYIRAVHQLETALAERTEQGNNLPFDQWRRNLVVGLPTADTSLAERDRLLAMLLAIRLQAKYCLEVIHRRSRAWLHEYYFLLAAYGIYAAKFDNLCRRELVTAYTCASFATNRYLWALSAQRLPEPIVREQAAQAIQRGNVTARLEGPPPLSHHAPLVFAQEFVRSRTIEFVQAGCAQLQELSQQFPNSQDVWQELALAYLELAVLDAAQQQAHMSKAEQILALLAVRFPESHFETQCRFGRVFKDKGDAAADKGDPATARRDYETSLRYYQAACQNSNDNYYPAINVACLHTLLGQRSESQTRATSVLAKLNGQPLPDSNEAVWILATRAEASLLLDDHLQAKEFYRQATQHPRCNAHARQVMQKQAARILSALGAAGGTDDMFN